MPRSQFEDTLKIGLAGLSGFLVSYLLSHPTSRRSLNKKLPQKRIKNLQYLPNIKYKHKDRIYWMHHWASYASLYTALFAFKKKSVFKRKVFNAFILGTIMQGLTYKDRFKFVHPIITTEEEPIVVE